MLDLCLGYGSYVKVFSFRVQYPCSLAILLFNQNVQDTTRDLCLVRCKTTNETSGQQFGPYNLVRMFRSGPCFSHRLHYA